MFANYEWALRQQLLPTLNRRTSHFKAWLYPKMKKDEPHSTRPICSSCSDFNVASNPPDHSSLGLPLPGLRLSALPYRPRRRPVHFPCSIHRFDTPEFDGLAPGSAPPNPPIFASSRSRPVPAHLQNPALR